ncbi:hypothetical protein [Acinetobacter venetianus]|uniref:hypothetical protein n=1 Tax=Acinetobacter venetianus TaxID=52133 RepID=UPI00241CDF0B|nr:hypothetical protein [Acinetobacter venetianus]
MTNMLEIILKTIPFTPLLYWFFSKTFRMAKKRKFYEAQISTLDDYIKNYYKVETIEFSLRDLKARQVTCNDWVGSKFLDFAIQNKCPNIFGAISDFDTSWVLIKLEEDQAGGVKLVCKYKKKTVERVFYSIVITYFTCGSILFVNKTLLIIFGLLDLSSIPTYAWWYNSVFYISVFLIVISAILLLSIGKILASTLSLDRKLPIEFKAN